MSAPIEFIDVDVSILKSPNFINIDLENGTLPEIMKMVNNEIQKTPISEIVLTAHWSEDTNVVDEIETMLKTTETVF